MSTKKEAIRITIGVTIYYSVIALLICCQVEILKLVQQVPMIGGAILVFIVSLIALSIMLLTTKQCGNCDCKE